MNSFTTALLALVIISPLILGILLWVYLQVKKNDDDEDK